MEHFDVRAEAARLHAARGATRIMTYVGLGALFGFGTVFAVSGLWDGFSRIGLVFGGCLWAAGVYLLPGARRELRVQIVEVQVTADGLRFLGSDSSVKEVSWKSPGTKVELTDWRPSRIVGMTNLRDVPCTGHAGPTFFPISIAALKAIRQSAIDAGLSVIDTPADATGKSTWIGPWPNIPRPMVPPPPYD